MSKYTTMLRWIVEQKAKEYPAPEGQRYADGVYDYLGLGSYPIFDAAYRSALNDKIIDHFYFREIGFETAAQFAWYMRRTMNEIMPKYNALYTAQATMDAEHPLSDYVRYRIETWIGHVDDDSTDNLRRDFTGSQAKTYSDTHNSTENDTHNSTVAETNSDDRRDSGNTSSTDHNRNVFQDTPMSLLSNTGSPSVEGLDYATNVTYDDGSGTTTSQNVTESSGSRNSQTAETFDKQLSETDASTTNDSRIEATTDARTITRDKDDAGNRTYDEYGNNRSWAMLMEEFADKWVNIDMMVIDDLETLFMGLW